MHLRCAGQGHRFRARVVVEFGAPIRINDALYAAYKQSKRGACQALLGQVQDAMRAVVVTARTYDDLRLIHTLRRLYQKASSAYTLRDKQDLSRRFSIAHRRVLDAHGGVLPADLTDLRARLEEYQETLDQWGIKDYQVNQLRVPFSRLLYAFLHCLCVWLLASIPNLLLNAPVGIAASYWATEEARKDLLASRVKVKARDVVMSKKIYFALIAGPILWLSYALLLLAFSPLHGRTIAVLLLSCPFFSYLGVQAVEAGMVDLKDLRPAFLRLLPAFRTVGDALPQRRAELQTLTRALVRKYGPAMGELYYNRDVKLDLYIQKVTAHCVTRFILYYVLYTYTTRAQHLSSTDLSALGEHRAVAAASEDDPEETAAAAGEASEDDKKNI